MTGRKRHRDPSHSKLELGTPLRGLKRSRSAFIRRRRSHARNDYLKASISEKSERHVSQDSGHALNWLDSLIRKGRGILDSLEEEEDLFKKELDKEKQRIRIQEQLVGKEWDRRIRGISEMDGSSFGSSLGLLEETLQNTLIDYNNKKMNQDYYPEDAKEATDLRNEREEIVILSDNDEEDLPVLQKNSEEPNYEQDSEQLIVNDGKLDLSGDINGDQGLEYHNDEKEKQDPEDSVKRDKEEVSEKDDGQKKSHTISPQSIGDAKERYLDGTNYYDTNDRVGLEDFNTVHCGENGDESEVNDIPISPEEIALIDSDEQGLGSEGYQPSEGWEEERDAVSNFESNQKREQEIEQEEEAGIDIDKGDLSGERDVEKGYISGEHVTENLIDYREIANQAILQASQISPQRAKSYSPKNDQKVSHDCQDTEETERRVPKSVYHNDLKFAEGSTDPHSEIILEPDERMEDANASFSFIEDGNTMYFSTTEEHGFIENPSPTNGNHSTNQSNEVNEVPSRYEVVFCQSTYSTTSDDDNAQIVEPTSVYVSPFAKEPISVDQIGEDQTGLLRRTLESLGESFDSESEDQMMEDANDFNPNSKDECLCNVPDFNASDIKESMKGISLSDRINADMCNVRTGVTFDENRGQMLGSQVVDADSVHSRESSNNVDLLVFEPREPDWIEEVESFQITDDPEGLILEEVVPGKSQDSDIIVSSDPIIEFESKPMSYADIILDEFTAPDLVEEANDKDDIENCIFLEEIEVPDIGETIHVISTEPIVEQPKPLLSANIELIELCENGNEEKVGDAILNSFNQMATFQSLAGKRFMRHRLLIGNCESQNSVQGAGKSHGSRPYSSASKVLLSPIRALSRVISGVKDVSNVLTDFVSTIGSARTEMGNHINQRLFNEDQEIKSLDECGQKGRSVAQRERELGISLANGGGDKFLEDETLALEYPFKSNESWATILHNETSREKAADSKELLSELADIQRMVQKFENESFSAFTEDGPSPSKNAVGGDVSDTLVKRDDESELDFSMEDDFLGRSESGRREGNFGRKHTDRYDYYESGGFCMKEIKGKGEKQGGSKRIYMKDRPTNKENEEDRRIKVSSGKVGTIRGQSGVPVETENLNKKVRGIDFYGDKGVRKEENYLSPVKHIEVEAEDLDLAHLGHQESNEEKGEPLLQAKEVKIEDEGKDSLEVPVEIENKETGSSTENRDLPGDDDLKPTSLDTKRRRGRKRKHSASVSNLDKRKSQRSTKGQNRNSKAPVIRSKAASTATSPRRRMNTRSKKTR